MKTILTDHGKILHWAGAHHLFPVRGATPDDVSFASPGELEGRTPIGWNDFFPALCRTGSIVVIDDEEGTIAIVPYTKAPSLGARGDRATDQPSMGGGHAT